MGGSVADLDDVKSLRVGFNPEVASQQVWVIWAFYLAFTLRRGSGLAHTLHDQADLDRGD